MPTADATGEVFLSYQSQHLALSRRIADRLLLTGYAVWVDYLKIGRTPAWRTAVQRAIPKSDVFVAIVCNQYFASDDCTYEWQLASRARGLKVAAVAYRDDWPELRQLNRMLLLDKEHSLDQMSVEVLGFLSAMLPSPSLPASNCPSRPETKSP